MLRRAFKNVFQLIGKKSRQSLCNPSEPLMLLRKNSFSYFQSKQYFFYNLKLRQLMKTNKYGKSKFQEVGQELLNHLITQVEKYQPLNTAPESSYSNDSQKIKVFVNQFYEKRKEITKNMISHLKIFDQNQRASFQQEFKQALKLFFYLHVKYEENKYQKLSQLSNKIVQDENKFAYVLNEQLQMIIQKIMNSSIKKQETDLREELLSLIKTEKKKEKDNKYYSQQLIDEMESLFDFNKQFNISPQFGQMQRVVRAVDNPTNSITFNPTKQITSQIFKLISQKQMSKLIMILGSKKIGKSFSEYLAYVLSLYTNDYKIFYLPLIEPIEIHILSKQLFLTKYLNLSKDQIEDLSNIYEAGYKTTFDKYERFFDIITQQTPSTILIDQCDIWPSIFWAQKTSQKNLETFAKLISKSYLRSKLIFSSSINYREENFKKYILSCLNMPNNKQVWRERTFSRQISDICTIKQSLKFEANLVIRSPEYHLFNEHKEFLNLFINHQVFTKLINALSNDLQNTNYFDMRTAIILLFQSVIKQRLNYLTEEANKFFQVIQNVIKNSKDSQKEGNSLYINEQFFQILRGQIIQSKLISICDEINNWISRPQNNQINEFQELSQDRKLKLAKIRRENLVRALIGLVLVKDDDLKSQQFPRCLYNDQQHQSHKTLHPFVARNYNRFLILLAQKMDLSKCLLDYFDTYILNNINGSPAQNQEIGHLIQLLLELSLLKASYQHNSCKQFIQKQFLNVKQQVTFISLSFLTGQMKKLLNKTSKKHASPQNISLNQHFLDKMFQFCSSDEEQQGGKTKIYFYKTSENQEGLDFVFAYKDVNKKINVVLLEMGLNKSQEKLSKQIKSTIKIFVEPFKKRDEVVWQFWIINGSIEVVQMITPEIRKVQKDPLGYNPQGELAKLIKQNFKAIDNDSNRSKPFSKIIISNPGELWNCLKTLTIPKEKYENHPQRLIERQNNVNVGFNDETKK